MTTNPQDDIAAARAAITALRDAGNAATPGPWPCETVPTSAGFYVKWPAIGGGIYADTGQGACARPLKVAEADGNFIALSRNMTPAICELLLGHLVAHEAAEAANIEAAAKLESRYVAPGSGLTYMRTLTAKLAALGRGM